MWSTDVNNKLIAQILISVGIVISPLSANAVDNLGGIGGVHSLRGNAELEQTRAADPLKDPLKQVPEYASNYVSQPPMIPHQIRHFEISKNANKCLTCHSWTQAESAGAPKISFTHYQNRQGETLADVSPRRYFCLQCHVTQINSKPLIQNGFTPVASLREQK